MSSVTGLLTQWHQARHLDTSKVPPSELAITLVLLYIRDEAQQVLSKARFPKEPVDLTFQRAILVELYAHRFILDDLRVTPVVLETAYEKTAPGSRLRKFLVACCLRDWRGGKMNGSVPEELQDELSKAELGLWDKIPWDAKFVPLWFLMKLIGFVLDREAEKEMQKVD